MGKTVKATTADAKTTLTSLGDLERLTRLDRQDVIHASFLRWVTDAFFRKSKGNFRTNPANTWAYRSLRSLEELCLIRVAEYVLDEHDLHKLPVAVRSALRRVDLLGLHRDALAHPATVVWRKPDRQAFFEGRLKYKESRAAIVWDFSKSLDEQLRGLGKNVTAPRIQVFEEMGSVLHVILETSRAAEVKTPSPEALTKYLTSSVAKYISLLERYSF